MGVLTDMIMATEEELAAVPEDEVPFNVLPGLDIKGTGPVELITLYELLTQRELSILDFSFLGGEESTDGPWVIRCPDSLIEALSRVSQEDIVRVAREWADTEELKSRGWEVEGAENRLSEMQAFAEQAVEAGKPIFLWTCL